MEIVEPLRTLVSRQVAVATQGAEMVGTLVNVSRGGGASLWLVVDDQDVFVPLAQVTSLAAA